MADQNIIKDAVSLEPMDAPKVSAPHAGAGQAEAAENAEAALRKDIRDLEFILDLPLEVSVELGRAKLLINDLLQLGQGSVVELNKFAGEPLEILVNNRLVARGEAVVVNEKFGVRITDIVSPMERVKQLG
ncbi:MAG: flagellar motor switch protein FliN [Desulfosoma sp.]